MGLDFERFFSALGRFGSLIANRYYPVDLEYALDPGYLQSILNSVQMGYLGLVIGVIIASVLAYFAAANITPSKRIAYPIGKFLIIFSRSIHETIWTILFVTIVGFGMLAGVMALTMYCIGLFGKLFSEELENVNMKKEWLQVINEYMGVEGIKINSALVSAQNRQRWYWTNIPTIEQPEQRGIVLSDILENDAEEPMYSNIYGGFGEKKPREHYGKSVTIRANSGGGSIPNVKIKDFDKNLDKMTTKEGKAYALTASYNGAVAWNSIEKKQRSMVPVVKAMTEVRTPEANQIRYEHKRKTGKDWSPRHMRHLVERPDEKMNTLTGSLTKQHILQITKEENKVSWRKLTPIECERLQTVPDNYTNHVSNTQRYKMLGNGWTIEVIAHILKNMEVNQ